MATAAAAVVVWCSITISPSFQTRWTRGGGGCIEVGIVSQTESED